MIREDGNLNLARIQFGSFKINKIAFKYFQLCHFIFLKKEAVNFSKSCLNTIHNPHSSVWRCRVTKVMLPPVTSSRHTGSHHLSCLCDQMSCEEARVCARLLFAECFHRVGGCVGGRRRGGVSSEAGIPETEKHTAQKGTSPFWQSHTSTDVHESCMVSIF